MSIGSVVREILGEREGSCPACTCKPLQHAAAAGQKREAEMRPGLRV